MSNITELNNIPDVVFTDSLSLAETQEEMLAAYAASYESLTGKVPTLADADPVRLCLSAASLMLYQLKLYIERTGQQNLLKNAEDSSLDGLGALKQITRAPAGAASATLRFSMESARSEITPVPSGTRVTTEDDIVFYTTAYAEIPAGSLSIDAAAAADAAGTGSNGLAAGALSIMVDPVPYIDAVTNLYETSGGTDEEGDESLTRRIYLAPEGYSVAGPENAYIAKALELMPDTEDVRVTSPNPCYITLVYTKTGGVLPGTEDIAAMTAALNDKSQRPQGDRLTVQAPAEVTYNISMTYYIAKSDEAKAGLIASQVSAAVADYVTWQRRIGRDVNPTELISKVRAAGVKRVELTSPVYQAIGDLEISKVGTQTITNGGIEND